MCGPALIAPMMLIGGAVSAAGQIQSGIYASQVARNQAMIAEQNKGLARENAIDAIGRGQNDQRQLGREVAARVGAQEARMAANNIDITSGSAARVIEDTQMIGREDSAVLAENTRRQVRSMQIDVWGYESEKQAKQSEAKQAVVSAAFGAASSALGTATQYAKFKAGR